MVSPTSLYQNEQKIPGRKVYFELEKVWIPKRARRGISVCKILYPDFPEPYNPRWKLARLGKGKSEAREITIHEESVPNRPKDHRNLSGARGHTSPVPQTLYSPSGSVYGI
jgi:hypothetical protein